MMHGPPKDALALSMILVDIHQISAVTMLPGPGSGGTFDYGKGYVMG
jgi:hypothetical protein